MRQIKANMDIYSCTSIPLNLISRGESISTATGFFYSRGGKVFLVSNWHVFSGRNPYSGQPNDQNGAIPDQVEFPLHSKGELVKWRTDTAVNLDNNSGKPAWFQHPKGQNIDVAILPFRGLPRDCIIFESNRPDETSNMSFRVGMDVFIVGFPLGLQKQGFLPVWKRGSVASEPDINVDGFPLFP